MAEFALFVLLLVGAFAAMVVLWRLIETETEDLPRMRREDAERAARADDDSGTRTRSRNR